MTRVGTGDSIGDKHLDFGRMSRALSASETTDDADDDDGDEEATTDEDGGMGAVAVRGPVRLRGASFSRP